MSALKSMSNSLKTAKLMKSKHKKLDEDWFDAREPIQDGVRFSARYLGMTVVDEPKGKDVTNSAVQRIVNTAKSSKKVPVQLSISSKGIKIFDQTSSQLISDVPIYSISFCAAMKRYLKIFAFVSENTENKNIECHAYLCNSVKEAQALNITVAQSFKIAFETLEPKSPTDEVEIETETSDVVETNGEKRPAALTIPTITERRYQRFSSESNPFDDPESVNSPRPVAFSDENVVERNAEMDDKGRDIFIFTTPLPSMEHQPSTPKSSQPITPLRPPPASTRHSDKSAPRRPSRLGSVGANSTPLYQTVPSPSQSTPDIGDWDQDFADLALSRTQDKPSVAEEDSKTPSKLEYPPSNPFFSPGNPFSC